MQALRVWGGSVILKGSQVYVMVTIMRLRSSLSLLSFAMFAGQAAAYSPSIVPLSEVPDQPSQEYCRQMRAKAAENNPEYPPGEDEMFPLNRSAPSWPKGARKNGAVKFEFVVGTGGRAKDIKVVETPGPPYTEEAVRTLKKWRYCPAFRDGAPVETEAKLTLQFALR